MREEKTSHQRLPKACCFSQESATWDCGHFIVWWWCRWFYGAIPGKSRLGDDAELGCRKAKTLVLLCLEVLRCASPGQLWFCCGQTRRKEGNFVPVLASVFTLHVKVECGSAEGLVWPLWMSISPWQQERSLGPQDTSGWGGLVHLKVWHKAVMLRLLTFYYHSICNAGLRMHPCKCMSRRTFLVILLVVRSPNGSRWEKKERKGCFSRMPNTKSGCNVPAGCTVGT